MTLDTDSLYEAPAGRLFPPEIGEEFSVVVSLSSWRANNAFLFSVRDGRDRLRFGIQLLPRRVVVYTAEKASSYFTYDWHDGRQHPFAIGVRAHSVSFYADCGAVQKREQTLGRSQALGGSGGLFTLGRMNSKAAAFSGQVCQLDIYPSARAAAHYCNYLKKQCRLADTHRLSSSHPGVDIEVNDPPADPPADPSTKPFFGIAATNQMPVKATAEVSVLKHYWVSSVESDVEDQSTVPLGGSTASSPPPDSRAGLDLTQRTTLTTTENLPATARPGNTDRSENSTEGGGSSGGLQTTAAPPGLVSTVRHVKEGLRKNSISSSGDSSWGPQQTHLRPNGTTLYRENHVDDSEQHDPDGSYDDTDTGGYDYGFEDSDYFYDYEEGFPGPQGDPGPPVSD